MIESIHSSKSPRSKFSDSNMLAILRRTATPAEFAVQAPAVIEHIRRMRDEIDAYLGVHEIEATSLRT